MCKMYSQPRWENPVCNEEVSFHYMYLGGEVRCVARAAAKLCKKNPENSFRLSGAVELTRNLSSQLCSVIPCW